jgi:anti-sigma factor (TIGR02949 family)
VTTKPIDCEQALKQIYEFIDRELRAGDHEAMERHLHTCKSCFSRVEFERLLKQRLGDLHDDDPDPHVSQRIRRLLKSF